MNTGKSFPKSAKIILFIIIVSLTVLIFAFLESRWYEDYEKEDLSSYSVSGGGEKALYDSLEEYGKRYGFDVRRQVKYSRFLPENSLTVGFDFGFDTFGGTDKNDIAEYVRGGSSFMYITETGSEEWFSDFLEYFGVDPEGIVSEKWGTLEVFRRDEGSGSFYMVETGGPVSNEGLKSSQEDGAYLMTFIKETVSKSGYGTVVFDEYVLGIQRDSTDEILGYGFILMIAELAVAAVVFCVMKAFPLGKPRAVYSIEKASESAHIEALAGLYRRTGSGRIAFDINMEALLCDLAPRYGISDSGKMCPYGEVCDEVLNDRELARTGLRELVNVYRSGEAAVIKGNDLKVLLGKIDEIRREL